MNSRNKPTAPPPPSSQTKDNHNQIVPENNQNNNPPPPDYDSATQNHETVVHCLVSEAMGGAVAKSTITKTVSDHSDEDLKNNLKKNAGNKNNDGWQKYEKNDSDDSENNEEIVADIDRDFKKPNTIVDENSSSKFIKLNIKIPGLTTKFITHKPKNGRIISSEYKINKVALTFILNENRSDKQTYKYWTKQPFKNNIVEEGSYFKYADNCIKWRVKKA